MGRIRHAGLEAQIKYAEIKLRAERKAGELLSKTVKVGNPHLLNDARIGLGELGINPSQSSRWQQAASVPEAEFEARPFVTGL